MTQRKIPLFLVCVLLVTITLFSGCIHQWRNLDRVISEDNIVSLDLGQSTHGSFLLGAGSINSISYYYYYKIETDGAYTLQKAPTEKSKIYMDSTTRTSRVVILNMDEYPSQCRDDQTDEDCRRTAWVMNKEYVFHVPKGTIVEEYDVGRGAP